ncbi:MAG: hypothetical protein AAGJ46_19620 [Planctomycetota bacterium]
MPGTVYGLSSKARTRTTEKTVAGACQAIRNHWSPDEAGRRRVAAEQMQQRLIETLRLMPGEQA